MEGWCREKGGDKKKQESRRVIGKKKKGKVRNTKVKGKERGRKNLRE